MIGQAEPCKGSGRLSALSHRASGEGALDPSLPIHQVQAQVAQAREARPVAREELIQPVRHELHGGHIPPPPAYITTQKTQAAEALERRPLSNHISEEAHV